MSLLPSRLGFFDCKKALSSNNPAKIFIGFDGFKDTIVFPVLQRSTPTEWQRVSTIEQFSQIILQACTKSANIECMEILSLMGGNAPLLTRTLCSLSQNCNIAVDLVAALSESHDVATISPIFQPLKEYSQLTMRSIGLYGNTHAFEFCDGKLLFGYMRDIQILSLQNLFQVYSENYLKQYLATVSAVVTVNWTMVPLVGQFWQWLADNTSFNFLDTSQKGPWLFVDLADPKKRSLKDIKEAFVSLSLCAKKGYRIIISVNLSEAQQALQAHEDSLDSPHDIEAASIQLFKKVPYVQAIVGHSHTKVSVCYTVQQKEKAVFTSGSYIVPYTSTPFATTGAGDAFNGGFLAALIIYDDFITALRWAIAASGIWVRTRKPADSHEICTFLNTYQL